MIEQQAKAERLRRHLLKLMEREGKWESVSRIRVLVWRHPRFVATLNTPFNPLPDGDGPPRRYELSLWEKGKLLLLERDADQPRRVVKFKRGSWEDELLALG